MSISNAFTNTSSVLGAFFILKFLLTALQTFYRFVLRPSKKLHSLGKWAVVTGATDGIGKALAMELASKGMDIMLISRTLSRLQSTQREIQAEHDVAVKIHAMDCADITSPSVRKELSKVLDQLGNIGVLYNNVGTMGGSPQVPPLLKDPLTCNVSVFNVVFRSALRL
jgi:17beta-estradiol 17-dehydrogenase / very-long-chain 3-oxoacyl-CoA reductase